MTERTEPIVCREVVELVTEYLDQESELTPEQRITIEQHLLVCPPCTTHVDQMRTTIALTKTLRTGADPTGPMAVFRKWKATR
jgi:hypothetical protein